MIYFHRRWKFKIYFQECATYSELPCTKSTRITGVFTYLIENVPNFSSNNIYFVKHIHLFKNSLFCTYMAWICVQHSFRFIAVKIWNENNARNICWVTINKPQKNLFLVVRPLRGGGDKGLATKKNNFFWSSNKWFWKIFCGH